MNRVCPTCGDEVFKNGDPIPIEENDKIGTLHFCSEECRGRYDETGNERSVGSE